MNDSNCILPRPRYVYGDAKAGGTFSEGELLATLSAIDIGPPEGEPSALAKKAADLFASADNQGRAPCGYVALSVDPICD